MFYDDRHRWRMRERCYPAKETAAKHEQNVKEVSRLLRERGFENVTVGGVTKAARLTHGAFFAHFRFLHGSFGSPYTPPSASRSAGFTLTQSWWTASTRRCSRKWMSGHAAIALVLLRDRGPFATLTICQLGEPIPPSQTTDHFPQPTCRYARGGSDGRCAGGWRTLGELARKFSTRIPAAARPPNGNRL